MKNVIFKLSVIIFVLPVITISCGNAVKNNPKAAAPLFTYTLSQSGTAGSYGEAMAVACLQGIINRKTPTVNVLDKSYSRPAFWLELLTSEGKWLNGREIKPLQNLDSLFALATGSLEVHRFTSPRGPTAREVIVAWAPAEETDFEVPVDAHKARATSMLGEATILPVTNGRLRIRLTGAPTYIEML